MGVEAEWKFVLQTQTVKDIMSSEVFLVPELQIASNE